jgi:hypothetical protein
MDLRPYRDGDEGALLALWNATLTHDAITPATFRTKVLLDPNFSRDGLLVADDGGTLAGFVLSLTRQVQFYGQGLGKAVALMAPTGSWVQRVGYLPGFAGTTGGC